MEVPRGRGEMRTGPTIQFQVQKGTASVAVEAAVEVGVAGWNPGKKEKAPLQERGLFSGLPILLLCITSFPCQAVPHHAAHNDQQQNQYNATTIEEGISCSEHLRTL